MNLGIFNRAPLLALAALLPGILCCGCGGPGEKTVPANPPPASPAPQTLPDAGPAVPKEDSAGVPEVTAYLRVIDLAGKPLSGINPIVSTQPNAFEKPVAVGQLTGADGNGTVRFKSDRELYLRAWDPNLLWFPNNFFTIPPHSGTVAKDMTISMVQAASIRAQFFLAGGAPAAGKRIELMMVHPQWGPWWPAVLQTDAEGKAEAGSIPPGKFTLEFKSEDGTKATLPDAMIMPAEAAELGAVPLF